MFFEARVRLCIARSIYLVLLATDLIYAAPSNNDDKSLKKNNSPVPNAANRPNGPPHYMSHTTSSRAKKSDLAILKEKISVQQEIIEKLEARLAESEKEKKSPSTDIEKNGMAWLDIGKIPVRLDTIDYVLKEVTPEMPDHETITTYVNNSNFGADELCSYQVDILKLYAVHYNDDYGSVRFENNKKGELNRHLLFHGTSVSSANPILRDGLVIPNKEGKAVTVWYGNGLYFADRLCLAARYAYNDNTDSENGARGVIFLNEVALGKQHVYDKEVFNDYRKLTPEKIREKLGEADSLFVHGKYIPNPNESKQLDDGTVVPSGKSILSEAASSSNPNYYNQYIVYSELQSKVRYFIYASIKKII